MPDMNATDTIALLKKTRAAAQAVKDEIERQNRMGGDPDAAARRRPILQRATSLIQDADEQIDDLEASQVSVNLDPTALDKLTTLAAELDAKIAANALLNLGLDSLTQVLNSVSEVKNALG
jgi:hypothetical protein